HLGSPISHRPASPWIGWVSCARRLMRPYGTQRFLPMPKGFTLASIPWTPQKRLRSSTRQSTHRQKSLPKPRLRWVSPIDERRLDYFNSARVKITLAIKSRLDQYGAFVRLKAAVIRRGRQAIGSPSTGRRSQRCLSPRVFGSRSSRPFRCRLGVQGNENRNRRQWENTLTLAKRR